MRIITERLILRDFVIDDWPAVLACQCDSRYLRFYPRTDRTQAEVLGSVQMFLDQQAERPRRNFQWAVTLRANGQLIGNCGIRQKSENEWEADIGYELAPDYWGKGYPTEAAMAIIDFGFQELKLHRIWNRGSLE